MTSKTAAADSQARLKAKREREEDAPRARAEYDARLQAVLSRTAELRAERLAREARAAVKEAHPASSPARVATANPAAGRRRSRASASPAGSRPARA